MDTVDKATRSRIMSSIKSVSKLELEARKKFFKGMRLRHQPKGIHGRPDFVNKAHKLAVFVHGCFWHGCDVCRYKTPKTNTEFWKKKIDRNIDRHIEVKDVLMAQGWTIFVVWEHEVRGKR